MYDERRFKRTVQPFKDLEVSVDLHEVITWGAGHHAAPYIDVAPLADWIEDGWVQLEVVSPYHIVPRRYFVLLDDPKFLSKMSGKDQHRPLCALAALYLHVLGKKVCVSSGSATTYAGGWADVRALNDSIFVECGTLNPQKPVRAMCAGETLLVLPYTMGCDELDERTLARLKVKDRHPQLGYVFRPKCKLQTSPFKPPLGWRRAYQDVGAVIANLVSEELS